LIVNASQLPKRYFGMHFEEGVAEYQSQKENNGQPFRILLQKNALDRMDRTFEGRPIYVRHVNEVNLKELEREAVGIVVKSFLNEHDGKRWVEFVVFGDAGHEKIAAGWKLSNAYDVTESGPGGKWHNVDYLQEVINGSFDHLALVNDPRYENSVIYTPEEFAAYNKKLKTERDARITNSKGASEMKFSLTKLFNRSEVPADKMKELLACAFQMPNGRDMTFEKLFNDMAEMDEAKKKNDDAEAKGEFPMAHPSHMVEVEEHGEKKRYNVKDLVEKYNCMHKAANDVPSGDEEAKKKALELAAHEEKEIETKKNALETEKKAIEAREKDLTEKTRLFNERKAAAEKGAPAPTVVQPNIMTMADHLALGKQIA
jgi:hypothetical protein